MIDAPKHRIFRSLRGTTQAIVLAPEYSVNCRQLVRHVQ
jgi:hypothetical protein